jgi:uncharacterized protein (DUF2141 family)
VALAPLPEPDNRLYLGTGGSGKSTLARYHASAFPRVILCDPNNEKAAEAGAFVTGDPRELRDHLIMATGSRRRLPFRVTWRFNEMGYDDGFEFVNRCAKAAGDLVIVWDELDMVNRRPSLSGTAFDLWNAGRHHRVRIFACARRPARVPRDTTGNLSRACVFATMEPRDLAFYELFMGREAVAAVRSLAPRQAVDWTPRGWAAKKSLFS